MSAEVEPEAAARAGDARRQHVRGSGVMLVGRGLSLALNVLSQILVVRCLAKSDYGAYAYALAALGFGVVVAYLLLRGHLPGRSGVLFLAAAEAS